MYLILGCGSVGKEVAEKLKERGKELIIIDRSSERVESLKELGFEAKKGDLTIMDLANLPVREADSVLILSSSDEANLAMLSRIKEKFPNKFVLVRANTSKAVEDFFAQNADEIILNPEVVGQVVLRRLEEHELKAATRKLIQIIKEAKDGGVAVFIHDNPDPDAISSALAFSEICKKYKISCRIFYSGTISHQENRALVNLVEAELERVDGPTQALEIVNAVGKVALIETSIPGVNNCLPTDVVPDIVIDHHEVEGAKGGYIDVRSDVVAVATILTQYLQQLSIIPNKKLATCLLYAIRVDTALFLRSTTPAELQVITYLSSLADPNLLNEIESPSFNPETIDALAKAIERREVRSSYLVTSVGYTAEPNAISQAADFLLRLEGVSTVLVMGIVEENIQLSSRTRDARVNLASMLQQAFGAEHAGGHATAAGGKVPLGIFSKAGDKQDIEKFVENAVKTQFFSLLNGGIPAKT
jgi:nanoRNase/pAp phosphatase (c-di-AMP/oligoRNAs hydrolase)